MAEAVVSIALETFRDLLLEESKFLSGVCSEVKGLETQLKEMKCLLEDADKRQHESKTVRNWIQEITDLAHRAEDAIETYAVQISSKRGPGFKKLLRRFSCVLNEGFSLHEIGSEISKIESEIKRVKESMENFGIKSIIQGESSTANPNDNRGWKRQTNPFEIEDYFVGKDEDLKRLVSLVADDKQHRVISIWGMGGIGKTTIARKVYNHTEIKRYFECFAWVCITQHCQIRSVLEDVLKQLIAQKRDEISIMSNTELIHELCRIQRAKRCMVVLDDLWEIDHWDGLKRAFLVEGSNSKILLTTRNQNVADIGFAFELGLLNIDHGWELLKKKAFPHNIPDSFGVEEKQLQEMGKEMVHKCGYLPLVISVLGGLLSKKKSIDEWELVNEKINVYLYRGIHEEENAIHGVLNLSYEDLPFYLKPCFLFMGQFREDKRINPHNLYRLWIVQGMISHENQGKDGTLMDIAEVYLSELVSRCLVQAQLWNVVKQEKYRTCQLHDVVRELCLSKGKKEGFDIQVMNYRGGKFGSLLNESLLGIKTRHLAVHFAGEMESEVPDGFTITREETSKHIRSLQFLNELSNESTIEFQHNILDLTKFILLRVLVFQGFRFEGRKLPRGIGNLIHLRHLAVQFCKLDKLPPSISNLKYLHTLDLYYSWDVRVPNILLKMHRLKHLILPSYHKENIGTYRLTLEGPDELETLYNFNSLVHDVKSVMRMKNLSHISADVYDNESLLAIINVSARSCVLRIMCGCQLTSTEEGLTILKKVFSRPNLYNLAIWVPIRKLHLEECVTEIISSRLIYLTLYDCAIEDDPMGILGKFPFLEFLQLRRGSFEGEEMKCHASGFPRLKELKLDSLSNLRKWTVEQGAMPLLSEITIRYCRRLEMIPNGLKFVVNLQELTLIGMARLAKRVEEEGEDFHKAHHVPSIIIRN